MHRELYRQALSKVGEASLIMRQQGVLATLCACKDFAVDEDQRLFRLGGDGRKSGQICLGRRTFAAAPARVLIGPGRVGRFLRGQTRQAAEHGGQRLGGAG